MKLLSIKTLDKKCEIAYFGSESGWKQFYNPPVANLNLNAANNQDAATFDEVEQYDLITTFDAVHDQARPDLVLRNIYNALRPNGTYLMQDIHASTDVNGNMEHHIAPFLYTVSCMHCMTVSLAAGGMGLGTMWGQEKAMKMLSEAGFTGVDIKRLAHDLQNDYYITKKN